METLFFLAWFATRTEFGHELALAASLITAPDEAPLPEIDYDWLQLQSALHRLAIDWEIMDSREKRWLIAKPEELAIDIKELRRRYNCLLRAPRIADADRFPSKHIICRVLADNRNLKQQIEIKMVLELDRLSYYRAALYELEESSRAWQILEIVQGDFYGYVFARRMALKRLLDELGPEAYGNAMMPPAYR